MFMAAWKNTPGAVAWVRENDAKTQKQRAAAPHATGPLTFIKKWLREKLPQEEDVWQADFRQVPNPVMIAGEPVRPWLILVTSSTTDLVLAHQIVEEEPSAALLWDTLVQAMRNPIVGEPHRPTQVEVRPGEPGETLRPHLDECGVELVLRAELDHVDMVFQGLTRDMGGRREPGLLDVPGVTPEQVGGFYDAAASFFEKAPWRGVGYESAIRIECDKFHSGPWYGVLMGQSGLTTGFTLYEDLKLLRRLWTGSLSDEENARITVATTVLFGEPGHLPFADVEAARHYGWRVARPDAYPSLFHKDRGMTTRPPLAWEMELMEGCLRAVPDFVKRRRQDDPTKEEMVVPVAAASLKLVLGWVVEDGQ
jgi:hypothetical protein